MDQYERNISLKTIYLTLVRRLAFILLIFIPIAIASVVVTQFMMTKTYQSTAVFKKSAAVYSQPQHLHVQDVCVAQIDSVVEELGTQSIVVTANEIKSGLTFSAYTANQFTVTVSFQSTKSNIVQPVLKLLSEKAKDVMVAEKDYASTTLSSEASAAKKNSSENKYLLIALAADVVLALGIPFVYEIVSDEVYDAEDLERLGCAGFTVAASK